MITINEKHTDKTFFMKEEYFPIKVCLNNYIDNIKYTQYEKDEYILMMSEKNSELENQLTDTQLALCDVYELIG